MSQAVTLPKKKIRISFDENKDLIQYKDIHTVCEESKCPNRFECSQANIATFLIGGRICTRACKFCHIATGKPVPLKQITHNEQQEILNSVTRLGSKYVVITAVTRDDDEHGLAQHFANLTGELNHRNIEVELLIPDFHTNEKYLNIIAQAKPLVIAQNIETVKRLTKEIRPQAGYRSTMDVFQYLAKEHPRIILKSGFMLGLGETDEEIEQLLLDLKENYVDIITVGQYMQPTEKNAGVKKIYTTTEFNKIEAKIIHLGFKGYEVGPYVRSSYMASRTMERVKKKKYAK